MIVTRKTSTRSTNNKREIENKSKDEATIYLYGDIGGYFGVDHLEFVKEFNKITASEIHLRVDSGGGDIFAARAIKTAIQQHKAKVIAHVDGLAASAASFLIMGCDEIEIVDGGFIMIHNAMSFMDIFGYFNINDLNELITDIGKEVALHEKLNESIANDYCAKCKKKTKDDFMSYMDAETWFDASEALAIGMVDRIYDGEPVEGSYDLSVFAKVPESLKLRNQKESKRTIEKALRDVGVSKNRAKDILANGFNDQPEEESTDRREAENVEQREAVVEIPSPEVNTEKPKAKDRIADLLCRAEIIAPSI
jgi:ATP-dependent Clp protease protease subunit